MKKDVTRNMTAAAASLTISAAFAANSQVWAAALFAVVGGWCAKSAWDAFQALPDGPSSR